MWNRIASFLILCAIIGLGYAGYYYFFVINKGTLELNANVGEYTITLTNSELKTSFSQKCSEQKCLIGDLAPFLYQIVIEKEGYKTFQTSIQIQKKVPTPLQIFLQQQIVLRPESLGSQNKNNIEYLRKLSQLRQKVKFFQTDIGDFFLDEDGGYYILKLSGDTDKELYRFTQVPLKDISLHVLYGENEIVLQIEKSYKGIDLFTGKVTQYPFEQDVKYIKKDGNRVSFVNEKGTFLYDITTEKIEYFYPFRDFVFFGEKTYLGVIFSDENEKKNNFGISEDGNLLVLMNYQTQEKKVLETLSFSPSKMIKIGGEIYLYDNEGKKYLLDNYK